MEQTITIPNLENEPPLDFSDAALGAYNAILTRFHALHADMLGCRFEVPARLAGEEYMPPKRFWRENPAHASEILGHIGSVGGQEIDIALEKTSRSADAYDWARMTMRERAPYLRRAAQKLRDMRITLIALEMLEIGKHPVDADAEVCEAIDFCEHYAAWAEFFEKLDEAGLVQAGPEVNECRRAPVGVLPVCGSIQPWNLPIALPTGPAAAALVCGYAVAFKPAEQSSIIGSYVADAFYRSGIPPEVFHFLPGAGEDAGTHLVRHPAVSAIAFTGSLTVARQIEDGIARMNATSIPAELPDRHRFRKRVVALEAGGKNAFIVNTDADLDRAVVDVATGAFTKFQGQLCSATSRAIVVDPRGESGPVYRGFITRLRERVESISVGPPEDFSNLMGPLIDASAREKVEEYARTAKREGYACATGTVSGELNGHFVPPMVVDRLPPDSRIAREEIFGPILAVFCVQTFDEAIQMANDTEFGLTAGVWTDDEEAISSALRYLVAGNIYIRRHTTGSVVGRNPFGGRKCSGNGTKSGGWDALLPYLFGLTDCTHSAVNMLRHGIPGHMQDE